MEIKTLKVKAGIASLTVLFTAGCDRDQPIRPEQPNVLFIVVDDMNGYGPREEWDYVKTPYLDDVPYPGRQLVDSLRRHKYTAGEKDLEKHRQFLWAYAANTSFADWNVGRVIEALDSSQYAENTLVIVASDNGFHTGEKERWGKGTLWEQADYVPFMIRTLDKKKAISTRTVGLIDVYPTLVDYCNLEPPAHELDGQSMVPLLEDPQAEWNRPNFTSYGVEYSSVRTEQYRYLRYADGSEEFYDHRTDPYEHNNLAHEPGYRALMDSLAGYIPENWAENLGGRWEVSRRNRR